MAYRLTMVELLLLVGVLVIAAVLIVPRMLPRRHHDPMRRAHCAGNLKQVGIAMLMYSADFDGYFPPTPRGNSFEPMNTAGYLNDSKVYGCPRAGSGRKTAADTDYWYSGGGFRDDDLRASSRPLAYDLNGNHNYRNKRWMNVLFLDGHVDGGKPGGNDFKFNNTHAVVNDSLESAETLESTANPGDGS